MGWRFLVGLPLAAAVSFALFIGMQALIDPGEMVLEEGERREKPIITPDFDEIDPPPPPDPKPPIIPDPPPVDPRPDPGPIDPVIDDGVVVGPTGGEEGIVIPVLDRDPQPIVRVPPQGFENCLSDQPGEEHRVRLVFDVSPTGETANIEVVDSTDSCFNRSAIRAAARWRYAPEIKEGEPVWRYGVETTIVYRGA